MNLKEVIILGMASFNRMRRQQKERKEAELKATVAPPIIPKAPVDKKKAGAK